MNTQNKQFIERYLAAMSGNPKPADVVQLYVDDKVLEEHIAIFEAAFPGYELIAEDLVAEGDKVAVRATARGRHLGEFNGIPASGNEFSIPLMLIYRIANGRIVEHWMTADSLGLLQQLGVVPA